MSTCVSTESVSSWRNRRAKEEERGIGRGGEVNEKVSNSRKKDSP
jgi:hypothetical protein